MVDFLDWLLAILVTWLVVMVLMLLLGLVGMILFGWPLGAVMGAAAGSALSIVLMAQFWGNP